MSITKQHLETLQPSSTLLINETSKEMERNGKGQDGTADAAKW